MVTITKKKLLPNDIRSFEELKSELDSYALLASVVTQNLGACEGRECW